MIWVNASRISLKEVEMENLWQVFFWSGPIGVGIFLALLGVFIWLLAKADEISKRTKAMVKDQEKKKE